MFAPRNSSEKVPMYSSSNYSLSLCDYVSDEVSEKRKHQKQKIYDFSHNNIFEAINANDMAALGYKLRYDRATLEIYHFTRSLSRLKTNSKICQLFRRLIQLKIYIFLTARWFRNKNNFFEGLLFDHRNKQKRFPQKKVNTAWNNSNSFEDSEKSRRRKKKHQTIEWFFNVDEERKKKYDCLLFWRERFLLNKKMF